MFFLMSFDPLLCEPLSAEDGFVFQFLLVEVVVFEIEQLHLELPATIVLLLIWGLLLQIEFRDSFFDKGIGVGEPVVESLLGRRV